MTYSEDIRQCSHYSFKILDTGDDPLRSEFLSKLLSMDTLSDKDCAMTVRAYTIDNRFDKFASEPSAMIDRGWFGRFLSSSIE